MFAAKAALPFCTPRMAAVHVAEDSGTMTHEQFVRMMAEQLADDPHEPLEGQ